MLSWESIFSFNCQINLFTTFNSATAESPLTKSNAINFALEYEKQIYLYLSVKNLLSSEGEELLIFLILLP